MSSLFIGTAGWTIPAQVKSEFASEGSHLERYARVLPCVEINSAFHRSHKAETYERWAASVPDGFRFSVKLAKYFTHEKQLKETGSALRDTLDGIAALGPKWHVLLVQLPPSLKFDRRRVEKFFAESERVRS